jgi:hypothetical protein
MTKDHGKYVFDLLGFQYKPLEQELLKTCTKETAKLYNSLSYIRKIRVLDKMAEQYGL